MDKDIRKKVFLKLYYSILDWEWYDEPNTFRVFMHLLLIANRKDQPYHGDVIHRGEALASLNHIASSTGLSINNVRTALKNLQATHDITQRKIGKTSVYRLNSYSKWQKSITYPNNDTATSQQYINNNYTTKSQRVHNNSTTPIYCKNDKNDILKECESNALTLGTHNNVIVSKDEYERFLTRYPDTAEDIINQLSEKIATGDPQYQQGHIGHLYVFARNNRKKPDIAQDKPSYSIEVAMERAANLDPTKTKRWQ